MHLWYEVVIRTNGGLVEVSAASDTVDHYGVASIVDVKAVDSEHSYHEHGEVGLLKAKEGHFVIEDDVVSSPTILITSVEDDVVKIDTKKDIVVTVAEGSEEAAANVIIQSNNNSKIQVEEGSAVQVTGEKEEIKVTKVKTITEIQTALSNKDTYIMLMNDISDVPSAAIVINYECVFDGNGFSLTSPATGAANYRIMNIAGCDGSNQEKPLTVVVKNLTMHTRISGGTRVLCAHDNVNTLINLNHVSLQNDHQYAFYIGTGNEKVMIDIENGTSSAGYSAIYNHSDGILLTARNSTFAGINPCTKGANEENWFSTIIVAEYAGANNLYSESNKFTFDNCKITAACTNKNDADPIKQFICDVRSYLYNSISFNNCNFECEEKAMFQCCEFDNYYLKLAEMDYRSDEAGNSKIYLNGSDVTNSEYTRINNYYAE